MPNMEIPIQFFQCKGYPAPDTVYVKGCTEVVRDMSVHPRSSIKTFQSTFQPCNFVRGEDAQVTITFTPQQNSTAFHPVVRGSVYGIWRYDNLDYEEGNSCKYLLNGACPLRAGVPVTYRIRKYVEKSEMKINGVRMRYTLLADNKKDVLTCFEFHANSIDRKETRYSV